MRIAIVHPDFRTKGGAENIVFWLAEELSQRDEFSVTIFSIDFADWKEKFSRIPNLAVEEIFIPGVFRHSKFLACLFAIKFFLVRRLDFSVINVHNFPATVWVGIAALLKGRRFPRIIWSCNEPPRSLYRQICNSHTPFNLQLAVTEINDRLQIKFSTYLKLFGKMFYKPLLRFLDKLAVRTFHLILPISRTIGEQVKRIYHHKNVFVCYPGIKEFSIGNISRDEEDFFLTVSRLEGYKNIFEIIRAWTLLMTQEQLGPVRHFIIGRGPFYGYLNKLINDSGLADKIKLLGYVSRQELLDRYRKCLAVVYVPYDETYGLPYLEAAIFSKPSIASNHGGPAEIVQNGENGLLVNPANPKDIAQAMIWMYQNKEIRRRMGVKAQKILRENFTWSQYVEKFITLIQG